MIYEELLDLERRINTIAHKHCKDYPDIETVKPYEKLWAIEQTLMGRMAANEDLHAVIAKLQVKYGIGLEELFELGDLARKENDLRTGRTKS